MIKSKAIEIIQALDENEFNDFGKFVNSPFFNTNTRLIQLTSLFKKYYPAFSQKNFTKENIYKKLFPGKTYNDSTIRKLLSGLQSLAEEYLSHSALNFHHFNKKYFLLNRLEEKKLDVLFKQHLDEAYRVYEQEGKLEDVYFRNNFEIYEVSLSDNASKGIIENDKEVKCFFYLISHCMILSLKMSQDLMVGNRSQSFDYKNTLVFKFIEKFDIESFINEILIYEPEFYPVLRIYYLNFLILSAHDEDDSNFWELKKLVWENIHKFSRFEKYNLMLFLENIASLRIRDGKTEFVKHIHEIHEKMLEDNIYESDDKDYLHEIRFWKIVKNAIDLKEFVWTKNFIEKYSQRLNPEIVKNMRNYAYAMLHFAMHEFDDALSLASRVKPTTFNIRYDLMNLKIKCYYELGLFEEVYYQLDSFKHLLKNDSSPEWAKNRFQKFVIYLDRLLKISENNDYYELELTKKELHQNYEVFSSGWLLEKIDKILQNNK